MSFPHSLSSSDDHVHTTLNHCLPLHSQLDLYGRAIYSDPARFPKSVQGAIVSLIFYGLAAVVIVISAMKLSTAAMSDNEDGSGTIVAIATNRIKFNGGCH